MRSYNHTQSTADTDWIIVHDLAQSCTASDVNVNINGHLEKILPLSVVPIDDNTLTVSFTTPFTGVVRVISV
jgi:hypothetical protein